jgi:FMN-dependent NADH-azoreductase
VPAARAPRTEGQTAAIALAAGLAEEVRSADAVLLAVPLYNFGIPQHVKTWIDVVLAGAKSADEALLAGRPAVLVVVRGGAYGAGTPREGWDHSTGYLRRIIADVWGADLTLVERELPWSASTRPSTISRSCPTSSRTPPTSPRHRRARPSPLPDAAPGQG